MTKQKICKINHEEDILENDAIGYGLCREAFGRQNITHNDIYEIHYCTNDDSLHIISDSGYLEGGFRKSRFIIAKTKEAIETFKKNLLS